MDGRFWNSKGEKEIQGCNIFLEFIGAFPPVNFILLISKLDHSIINVIISHFHIPPESKYSWNLTNGKKTDD